MHDSGPLSLRFSGKTSALSVRKRTCSSRCCCGNKTTGVGDACHARPGVFSGSHTVGALVPPQDSNGAIIGPPPLDRLLRSMADPDTDQPKGLPQQVHRSSGRDRRTTEVDVSSDVQAIRNQTANIPVATTRKKEPQDQMIIEGGAKPYVVMGRTGKGSFGVVFQAVEKDTENVVAIKRVLQDPRYKNRELQVMKMLTHINCVQLFDSFLERSKTEVFLNLVLAYIPKNLYEVCNQFQKARKKMPIGDIQLYGYQLCRALAYIHSLGICHRDIKPQNLLINPETHELKLCDFGSAKILVSGEPHVSYICSRFYRAPELIFGASDYTTAIDIWSSGCVMAELVFTQPIFAGESGLDQLVEIIKVLGTPTKEEISAMSPDYQEYTRFPSIKPHPWEKVFPDETPPLFIDLVAKMLVYIPGERILPLQACGHSFFDELRSNHPEDAVPLLFNFSDEEISQARESGILDKLLPPTYTFKNQS